MRNPKWHRDEIILALDLYFDPNRGSIDKKNPNIIELSQILNKLPLFSYRPDAERFRNPNGVALKLSNFLPFDEAYTGRGMKGGSKLDMAVFKEFENDRDKLHALAREIKKAVNDQKLNTKLYTIEEDEQISTDSVREGQVLYKLHKVRERDAQIVRYKKQEALSKYGFLACEVCVFDFNDFYGELGKGYIECHHKTPLSSFKVETETRLTDLALVCSNCHRMLHKSISTLTIEDLRTQITYGNIHEYYRKNPNN